LNSRRINSTDDLNTEAGGSPSRLNLEDDEEDDDYDEISVDENMEEGSDSAVRPSRMNNDKNEDNEDDVDVDDERAELYSGDEMEDEDDSGGEEEEDADVEDEEEDEAGKEIKITPSGEAGEAGTNETEGG